MLENTADTISAEAAAQCILRGIQRGSTQIEMGFEGWMLGALTKGFSPISTISSTIIEVC